ncbi:riboflavin synthase [Dethiobacter alkaliphilus]|uniref:riboflavin synthase n=1 Tax=Dethiobacter alkaliphilus TaxID=427926 RepID=UPI00222702AC|nr:riboflavin synthase [Dethiobacter alkaliphilus]MCW3490889.1 riboflavin synthase [Dethiobacter alkaliphilus]
MFTGIVEELGTVKTLSVRGDAGKLSVKAKQVLTDVRLGDSIAVNGVCLTVTSFSAQEFVADVMPETLRKTNLLQLQGGDPVNLERALALGGRLGGHLVSGHVDGVGAIVEKRPEGNAVIYRISAPPEVLRYIIAKGSVAIDGISLTVADVSSDAFSVSVIPHTASVTTLGYKKEGDAVNLENDMIGKYVERLLSVHREDGQKTDISMELLKANGFLQ